MTPIQRKIVRTQRFSAWKENLLFACLFMTGLIICMAINAQVGAV